MRSISITILAALAMMTCVHKTDTTQKTAEPQAADSSVQLLGTTWKLTELNGQVIVVQNEKRRPNLVLQVEGKAGGHSGCNRFFGGYELDSLKLRFSQLASTRMACPDGMELETAFLKALGSTTGFKLSGSTLELFSGEALQARLKAEF